MTDATTATWHVHDDGEHEPTLWYGDTAVLRRFELPSVRISTGQSYDLLWDVLTRVLAPDEATIERDLLYEAWAVIANVSEGDWEAQTPEWRAAAERWREQWHASLAGTAAQDAEVSTDA